MAKQKKGLKPEEIKMMDLFSVHKRTFSCNQLRILGFYSTEQVKIELRLALKKWCNKILIIRMKLKFFPRSVLMQSLEIVLANTEVGRGQKDFLLPMKWYGESFY